VALARDLHPEFGYVGSPARLRRIGVTLSFAVFGLVAGAGGVQVLTLQPDSASDPMRAMALAPTQGLIEALPPAANTSRDIKSTRAPPAHAVAKPAADNSSCREAGAELLGNDCAAVRVVRPRPARAMNERPTIAAVAIGRPHDPTMLPPEPATPVVAPEVAGTAIPAEAAPVAKPASPGAPPAATPTGPGNAVASGDSDAKAIDGDATAASANRRRAAPANAIPIKDMRDSDNPPAHRHPRHRSARVDAFAAGNDVLFNHRRKQLTAFTRTLGIHIPPRLLDLAR
jgi:hypothetical protein